MLHQTQKIKILPITIQKYKQTFNWRDRSFSPIHLPFTAHEENFTDLGLRSYRNSSGRLLGPRRHARHKRPRHGREGPGQLAHQGLLLLRNGDGDGVGPGVPDGHRRNAAELRGNGRGRGVGRGRGSQDGVEDAVGHGGAVARRVRVQRAAGEERGRRCRRCGTGGGGGEERAGERVGCGGQLRGRGGRGCRRGGGGGLPPRRGGHGVWGTGCGAGGNGSRGPRRWGRAFETV